jgi:hypothetical protein
MFKCLACERSCEDIDSPNCTDECSGFTPQKVMARHLIRDGNMLCTGNRPRPGVITLGNPAGVNCIRCRTILRSEFAKKRAEQEKQAEQHYENLINDTPPEEETESDLSPSGDSAEDTSPDI